MEDQEKNFSPEQPNETPRNPKEDIPLWLQGLEEETQANRLASEEETNADEPEEIEEVFSPFEELPQEQFPSESVSDQVEETETPDEEDGKEEVIIPIAEKTHKFSFPSGPPINLSKPAESISEESEEIEEEILSPASEETPQESISSEQPLDQSEPLEMASEETDAIDEVLEISSEEILQASPFPESSIEITEIDETVAEELPDETTELSPIEEIPDDEPIQKAPIDWSEASDTQPRQPESEPKGDTEEIDVQPETEPSDEENNPEWINEVPDAAIESPEFEEHTQPQNIIEEDYVFANDEPDMPASEVPTTKDDDRFIDISEAGFEHDQQESTSEELKFSSEAEQFAFQEERIVSDDESLTLEDDETSYYDEMPDFGEEESLPDDEELPKWLQRLIADSYPDLEFSQPSQVEDETWDEITKPVLISPSLTEEMDELKDLEDFDLVSELEESKFDEEMEISESDFEETTLPESIAEEVDSDAQPVVEDLKPVEGQGTIEWSEEDNLYFNPENGYVIEIPEPLQFARQVLIHGDRVQALEIIKTYISEGVCLDEIKIWLLEAADSKGDHLSEIWESIGDIAESQNKHPEALSAYSKAINHLLVTKDENGTG